MKSYSRLGIGSICILKKQCCSIPKNQKLKVINNLKIAGNHRIKMLVMDGSNRIVMIPTDYLKLLK